MKKKLTTLALMSFIGFFSFTSCSSDDSLVTDKHQVIDEDEDEDEDKDPIAKEITFKDARLAAQVKLALGLGEDDKITEENILKLEKLVIDGSKDVSANGDIREIA